MKLAIYKDKISYMSKKTPCEIIYIYIFVIVNKINHLFVFATSANLLIWTYDLLRYKGVNSNFFLTQWMWKIWYKYPPFILIFNAAITSFHEIIQFLDDTQYCSITENEKKRVYVFYKESNI